MTPIVAFHGEDVLAIAAVILLWVLARRFTRRRRERAVLHRQDRPEVDPDNPVVSEE